MVFDYERDTKGHYKNEEIANKYHEAFTRDSYLKHLRHRSVASRERAAVLHFMKRIAHKTVLDIPAGTGKLAPIFERLKANVTACDISEQMLSIARLEYHKVGINNARFRVCDAEAIADTLGEHFDVAVCLRLLHRVPTEIRKNILRELALNSDHTIASAGIETPYHRARRRVRSRLCGGGSSSLCYASLKEIQAEIGAHFDIIDKRWVFPFVSQEMVFLLRPRSREASYLGSHDMCSG